MIRVFILCLIAASAIAQEFEYGIGQTDQVTRGLISYWSMRNSGTTVYDEWGGNNGFASNSPTFSYASGVVGNGVETSEASASSISIGTPASLLFLTQNEQIYTISAWVKPTATNETGNIVARMAAFDAAGIVFRLASGKLNFYDVGVSSSSAIRNKSGQTVLSVAWHNVTCVVSGTGTNSVRLYVDGALEALTSTDVASESSRSTTSPIYIGRRGNGLYFDGAIDEVRIHSVSLAADEIKQLYRMGATPRGIR
jgi:hypothetical protein